MGFFNDDNGFGIEDFFNRLTGEGVTEYTSIGPGGEKTSHKKQTNNSLRMPFNYVKGIKRNFFIFDFSGKKNPSIDIKDEEIINDYGEKFKTGKKALEIKTNEEIVGEYLLPKKIKLKNLDWTFTNGILEVFFRR